MVSERDRILAITDYLVSCGIDVNIGKNKARGNKGFFKVARKGFRIDIAKNQSEEAILKTLVHEYAHFIHYSYDKTLKSLDFILNEPDEYIEELLSITVDCVPKSMAAPLFEAKDILKTEREDLNSRLNQLYPDFNAKQTETKIKKSNLKYLLKYDNVKVVEGNNIKLYTIAALQENTEENLYLKIKSKQRAINRINAKIRRLNRYYNSPTELFARSIELYLTDNQKFQIIAPKLNAYYIEIIQSNLIPSLSIFVKSFFNFLN